MDDLAIWILIAVGIVGGALLSIFGAGLFLPRFHQVARSITLKQTPEAIWAVITDHANVPAWHAQVVKVERSADRNGHEVWSETYRGNYDLTLETTEAVAPNRLVRTIADAGGPFRGRWEFMLMPVEGGCKLTITEFGEVPNPYFRVMAWFFLKPEQYVEMYLRALVSKFGESVEIVK